jgi:CheY-like chemotaxis protein
LLEIINNILDFSKLEAEKLELREAVFDLEQLAQDVCMIVTPSLRDKDVDLLIDYDQFLPTQFIGDAGRIRQIILNLVGNAIKFTECGSIMLRFVGVQAEPDGGWQVHITVEDSGIGIMDQLKEHIFGEFNQIEDGANRRFEGTGLGLAITKKLVEVMGGEIWVDSIPGQGSCFGIKIALQHAAPADMPSTCLPEQLKTALVWIKTPLNRSLMERQLELLGVEARIAHTAAEYDHALKAAPPDVVLVGISRLAAARAILEGSDLEDSTLAGRVISVAEEPGEVADLPKPFTRTTLFEALTAAMDGARADTLERPLRVLAAEDNDTNQLVLSKMLQGLDIELQIVDDGLQVVEAFRKAPPDLILMDISMPGMDGMEATKAIRLIEGGNARVQIVAMTAHALHGDEDRIREAGIDHYMTKPLKKRLLEEHIEAVRATLIRDQRAS